MPSPLTAAQAALLDRLVERLRRVDGIAAIVLGGSHAGGHALPTSDLDVGLYYQPNAPIDIAALAEAVSPLDDDPRPDLVTPLGGWGPWINGGGWLRIHARPVDLLYRDLDRVAQVCEACASGQVEVAYQPGHPHGFVSSIYAGEIAVCRPLWDPDGAVAALKARVLPYPPALQRALLDRFIWEMSFALETARKPAARGDVAYVAGCAFRCVACLMQVLFALNRQYLLNEKGAVLRADSLSLRPPRPAERIQVAFASLAAPAEY
ncbi:MAG: nucleotidyltransferase domain-containing protein, partial [Caldilineaceae bacterium]|nr:nucleotidyltransferase domain-containing protein [Caldilineaceae bacterium]